MNLSELYKIDKTTPNASDKPSFIPAGIHDNIVMTEVKYDKTQNNNEFLAFYFENSNGDKLSHTEWPTKLNMPFERMDSKQQDWIKFLIQDQMSRLKQIVEVFIGKIDNDSVIEGGSFKEVAEKVIALLENKYQNQLVRVKIVYDNNGYTSLPGRGSSTFIESMDVEKENTKIRPLPSDKFERPNKVEGDEEKKEANPLNESDSKGSDGSVDDIPF